MKKILLSIMCLGMFVIVAQTINAQAPSSAYKICANEGQQCSYTGTGRVAFGAKGKFLYKNVSRGLACTNAAFGRDPVPGTKKKCYVRLNSSSGRITSQPRTSPTPRNDRSSSTGNAKRQGPPKGYVFCANEGKHCTTGDKDLTSIAYGANGKYKYRSVRNGVACNNRIFGDPAPGKSKRCYKFRKGSNRNTIPDPVRRNNSSQNSNNCSPNANQIAIYTGTNFGGRCSVKSAGNYANTRTLGLPNDSISSIRVGRNVSALLCQHNDFKGSCYTIRGNESNLDSRGIRQNQVSSLKVIGNRSTPVNRPRHSPPNNSYKPCAIEGGRCNLRGKNTVAYGVNGKFKYKRNISSTPCNNAAFGDPAPGVPKRCYYRAN